MQEQAFMKKLLLITGDLAAGKSTFAKLLSKRYHIHVFFKDSIKEVLGDTIGFSNREENKRLSAAAMEMMVFLFSECAQLGQSLILESNFHTAELERFQKLAQESQYETMTLELRGKVETLYHRYMNRMQNQNRHPVHLSTAIDVFENFRSCTEHLRSEPIPGRTMQINADDFAYQTDETLLSAIDAFMLSE